MFWIGQMDRLHVSCDQMSQTAVFIVWPSVTGFM